MMIYLTKFGESFLNAEGKIQTFSIGSEKDLTKKGREDAHQKGIMLVNEPIKKIYHSTLAQAKQTAQIISYYLNQAIRMEDARVNDHCLSILERQPKEEFEEEFKKKNYPGAESMEDAIYRATPFLDEITRKDENALIVGREGINQVALFYLLQGSEHQVKTSEINSIPVPNLCVYRVTISPNGRKLEHCVKDEWKEGFIPRSERGEKQ